jgi:hypothetical protein
MHRFTVRFIIVNAVHVSGGFSANHQELKNCTHNIWYVPGLLVATASGGIKQTWHVPDCWLYIKEYFNDARSHERQICNILLHTGRQKSLYGMIAVIP